MRCKDGFYKSIRQFRLTHRIGTGTFNRKYPFFLAARGGYWYGDAVIFRDEADRICDCPHADTLPDSGAADSAALRSLLDRLWLLLAAIVAHVPMESGKNGVSFSAILYDTSDSRSRLRSESGEHCVAVPEYRTAYKTIIQKIS